MTESRPPGGRTDPLLIESQAGVGVGQGLRERVFGGGSGRSGSGVGDGQIRTEGWIRVSGAVTKLIAYQLALELVQLIAHTRIADAHLRQQARAGLDLFRLVTYDAGACSKANARAVRDRDLHYLFALKSSRVLAARRSRALARLAPVESADASRQTFQRGQRVVRRLYLGPATAAPEGWEHLRTVVRVQTETFDASDNLMTSENRYLILPHCAYALLTLFRCVTQRCDERRSAPWKRLMLDVFTALLTTNEEQIRGLRFRPSS